MAGESRLSPKEYAKAADACRRVNLLRKAEDCSFAQVAPCVDKGHLCKRCEAIGRGQPWNPRTRESLNREATP